MDWDLEITPHTKWYKIDIKGIWRYRDLLYMYVKRDLTVQYKQTILGPLWYVVQPLLTTLIFMLVFGGLAGISTDGVPMPLFYMSGIMVWNYFTTIFSASSTLFIANSAVFGKVYFPRLIVPISVMVSSLAKFLVQFIIFVILYLYFLWNDAPIHPNSTIIFLPFQILAIAIFGMSSGLIISSLTAKYHDLSQVASFGLQLYMYATPIIYPLSAASESYRTIIMLNPLSPLFEIIRYSLMGCGSIYYSGLLYSISFIILTTIAGLLAFSNTERTFIDTI